METTNKTNDLSRYELPELKRKGLFGWQYTPTQSTVKKKEYYLTDDADVVESILEKRQFAELRSLHCKMLTPLELLVVGAKDGQFAAAQIRRYVPYEFKPESEIMVFKGADAEALLANLKDVKPVDKGLWK